MRATHWIVALALASAAWLSVEIMLTNAEIARVTREVERPVQPGRHGRSPGEPIRRVPTWLREPPQGHPIEWELPPVSDTEDDEQSDGDEWAGQTQQRSP
jgi:hypothetical protein